MKSNDQLRRGAPRDRAVCGAIISGSAGPSRERTRLAATLLATVAIATPAAMAAPSTQDAAAGRDAEPEQAAQESSTVIYDAAFFEQFNPVTLEDMLRNIPGGASLLRSLRFRGGERGFGSEGPPLLIDGRRMTGKANDIATRLARIQADQVERIELIRGNAEGLDIRSQGVLYNVILRAGAENSSSNFVDFRLNYVKGAPLGPEALFSHSGRRGPLEFGASYQYSQRPRITRVRELVSNPDLTPREYRELTTKNTPKTHTITVNLGYEFDSGAKIRLNGLYKDDERVDRRYEDQFLGGLEEPRVFFGVEEARFRFAETEWELGGDLEADVGPLGALKALFVLTRRDNDDDLAQDRTQFGIRDRIFSQVADFDEGETILRGSLTTPLGARHSLEYGGEGAFNTLDTTFAFNDDPFQSAIVEEDRYEAFILHNFAITNKLNLQSGVTGEFSTILQDRDGQSNTRSFQFIKPRIELRYDITNTEQIRLFAERTASQLNLNDFVASRNIDDDRIDFGNPDLKPETTWRFSTTYEKRFAGDTGAVQIEAFYERIDDHIDKILIGEASSGVGNIGSARAFGVETEFSTRFGFIGVPNAVLTLNYDYRNTETTDPFTGERRPIRRRTPHFFNIDFRHDIGGSKFSYGFDGHRRTITRRTDVNIREVTRFKRHVGAFGEYNLTPATKIRFTATRFLGDQRTATRTFFTGNIADDMVSRIERQIFNIKTIYELRFQGTF